MATLGTRQARFAAEYAVDGNGKQAAIRAGYSPRSAEVTASRLLRVAKVKAEVARLQAKVAGKLELNAERVLRPLAEIAETDILGAFNEDGTFKQLKDIPAHLRRAIASIEVEEMFGVKGRVVKLKLWPKVQALDLLGKNQKLWTDKLDLTSDGKPLAININFGAPK